MQTVHEKTISISQLKKVYGRSIVAVDGIDLDILQGKINALLGPNGAGKTTTLKAILGLVTYEGSISILGNPVDMVRSKISFVPEEKSFYDFLTLERAFRICSTIMEDFDKTRAVELARAFDLPLNKKIRSFSHGMKTSAYLSIALSERAEIYVLDEPTWGLDPIRRDEVLEMIGDIAEDGKTVLYTSHIIPEVEKIADVFSIMYKGKILYSGEMSALNERFRIFELPSNVELPKEESFFRFLKKQDKTTVLSDEPSQWEFFSSMEGAICQETDLQTFFHLIVRGN